MKEYYRWADKTTAINALKSINDLDVFPIVGKRASDGAPQPNKQQTERWADVDTYTDAKHGFPTPPERIVKISETNFERDYSPVKEKYKKEWKPEKVETTKK